MSILDAGGITKRFGGLTAVSEVDFDVKDKVIYSLIGPNGAGKTTFFNCLSGFYPADEGEILFDGMPLTGLRPDQITRLRIMARRVPRIRAR